MANEHSDRWWHDLRNAVNSALLSASVAERLHQRGEFEQAGVFLRDVRSACERASELLRAQQRTKDSVAIHE
jgi:hypothetical protein